MGLVLNAKGQYELFEKQCRGTYFVDKTKMLEILNSKVGTADCYLCMTRPRRFGKTVMANLISSYYAKGLDSSRLFDSLQISKSQNYRQYMNQYHVISLYMSDSLQDCSDYSSYINYHVSLIINDLKREFSEVDFPSDAPLWQILSIIKEQEDVGFIFVIDEWDSFFYSNFFTESDGERYLTFWKNLLKDKAYVELAYMTGVLPIKKYSSGSELNMFDEYYFPTDSIYDKMFGFTEQEVKELCRRNHNIGGKIQYGQLAEWYDGYYTYNGEKLYNPRSVNKALSGNQIKDYWTETGPGNEILNLVERNIDEVKEDIIKLVSGEKVYLPLDQFTTSIYRMEEREEILSAMVIYGFLAYYDSYLSIPNKELMKKFQGVLRDRSMGYIAALVRESNNMLNATLSYDTEKMEQILEFVHDTEIPILQYNDENSLACVVNLIYLSARDRYRIEREEKTGKGYVDFIFYPEQKGDSAVILELKYNDTPENAIKQIREKKYETKLMELQDGRTVLKQNVLLVGMTYDKKTKQHYCKVEDI